MNQRRTKEQRKNAETQKSTFIKIALSFTSLIPCPIPPTDNREKTERTPTQLFVKKSPQNAIFLAHLEKKVYLCAQID